MSKVLLCLLSQEITDMHLEQWVSGVEQKEIPVYTFYPCDDLKQSPHLIYQYIENYVEQAIPSTEFYLLTDMWDLLLVYRAAFPGLFHGHILYAGQAPSGAGLQEEGDCVYAKLLSALCSTDNPPSSKPILVVPSIPAWLPAPLIPFCSQAAHFPFSEPASEQQQKPFILCDDRTHYRFDFSHIKCREDLRVQNTVLLFEADKKLEAILALVQENIQLADQGWHIWVKSERSIALLFIKLYDLFQSAKQFTKNYILCKLELISQSYQEYAKAFALSLLFSLDKRRTYLNKIYSHVQQSDFFQPNEKLFVLWQLVRWQPTQFDAADEDTGFLRWALYKRIFEDVSGMLPEQFSYIPKEDRNKDFVVVITGQLLGLNHAPTKTALDRCVVLMRNMGKRVMLINCKEVLTYEGIFPLTDLGLGDQEQSFFDKQEITFRDTAIPYYQSRDPLLMDWKNIMQMVAELKPWYVLSIGATLAADLCSKLVPVITLATVFSDLPLSLAQFSITGRKMQAHELILPQQFGASPDGFYNCLFTFDFVPQTHTYTRKELGLPENKFLIAVVGGRLTYELDPAFIRCLLKTAAYGGHVVLIGNYERYEQQAAEDKGFAKHVTYLGMQEDVLAILELCNLYANPRRYGGGSSVVEAMYKNLPALTLPYGDVYVSAGEEFCCKDYDEMSETIIRYITDPDFYAEKARRAKQRADILTDTATEFTRIITEIEKSERFV